MLNPVKTNGQSDEIPLTPNTASTQTQSSSKSKRRSSLSQITQMLTGSAKESAPLFCADLKHLNLSEKQKEMKNNKEIITKSINCVTSSPFDHCCLFWEIEWNAIEIELKTKANGVIRSVPIDVGGHQWFVELYPRINGKENKSAHNCKFNFFVKSKATPIHAKFAVSYTKKAKNCTKGWRSIYSPNILVFAKNGAGFDKIVNFADLCSLCCADKKMRLKIEVQVFESVITKAVQTKSKNAQKIKEKIEKSSRAFVNLRYRQMQKDKKYADVQLICGEHTFFAHSCVLCAFSSLMNGGNRKVIELASKWDPQIVGGLLSFLYTQQIEENLDLLKMIEIANEFEVDRLAVHCLFKLSSDLSAFKPKIFDILLWTKTYAHIEEVTEIESVCLKFITSNLSEIISDKAFQVNGKQNPDVFQKILQFMADNK